MYTSSPGSKFVGRQTLNGSLWKNKVPLRATKLRLKLGNSCRRSHQRTITSTNSTACILNGLTSDELNLFMTVWICDDRIRKIKISRTDNARVNMNSNSFPNPHSYHLFNYDGFAFLLVFHPLQRPFLSFQVGWFHRKCVCLSIVENPFIQHYTFIQYWSIATIILYNELSTLYDAYVPNCHMYSHQTYIYVRHTKWTGDELDLCVRKIMRYMVVQCSTTSRVSHDKKIE